MNLESNLHPLPKKENIRFAVIVPIFNTEKYIDECLESLLSQSYKNFTGFLIDDGSTDRSGQIADQYTKKDSRLRVVHKENGGVSSARNVALDLIEEDGSFDYVLCLDSDDIWEPHCLETVKNNLSGKPNEVLFFGIQNFDKSGPLKDTKTMQRPPLHFSREECFDFAFDNSNSAYTSSPAFSLFIGNVVLPCNLIRKMRFNIGFSIGEDQDYKVRALGRCSFLTVISDRLIKYRLRRSSLSHSDQFNSTDLEVFTSWLNLLDELPPSASRVIEGKIADTWWNTLRNSANLGVLSEHWEESCGALQTMKERFRTNVLDSPKYRKRIRIFKLGRVAVKLYFSMRFKTPSSLKRHNYFD